ncbi:hypothetical protein GCM10010975_31230 [Comamonas phosphati]|nr:hypothetical protein GCM10010975_31230 [Comamonas phosphati]
MPRAPLHGPEAEASDTVDGFGASADVVFPPDLHGSHHLKLKALLLTIWVVVSFGTCYFARDLQALVPGWPIAYWMAAQGAVLMFLAIIVAYCVAMDYFERQPQTRSSQTSLPHA